LPDRSVSTRGIRGKEKIQTEVHWGNVREKGNREEIVKCRESSIIAGKVGRGRKKKTATERSSRVAV